VQFNSALLSCSPIVISILTFFHELFELIKMMMMMFSMTWVISFFITHQAFWLSHAALGSGNSNHSVNQVSDTKMCNTNYFRFAAAILETRKPTVPISDGSNPSRKYVRRSSRVKLVQSDPVDLSGIEPGAEVRNILRYNPLRYECVCRMKHAWKCRRMEVKILGQTTQTQDSSLTSSVDE